jgi:hypothetical protein
MGKRSRRHSQPRASASVTTNASAGERSLLDAIAAGDLDEHLAALANAVAARMHLLHTVKHANALAELCVGDEVRINHSSGRATYTASARRITAIEGHDATVCLHRPIGRFASGQVRCSPLALDRVGPQATKAA